MIVSPGFAASAACWMVRQGAVLVPAFASLPAAPSTYRQLLLQLPDGGGGGGGCCAVTVPVAVLLLPPLVAVIVAVPAPTPVTSPVAVTLATPALLLVHVTARPVRARPNESFGVALSCTVPPTGTLAVAGLTLTVATGRAAAAAVVPVTTLESAPNTAFTFSVPRYAASWKLYAVLRARPSTVQVRCAPTVVPATGVAHVPRLTLGAPAPQVNVFPGTLRIS